MWELRKRYLVGQYLAKCVVKRGNAVMYFVCKANQFV